MACCAAPQKKKPRRPPPGPAPSPSRPDEGAPAPSPAPSPAPPPAPKVQTAANSPEEGTEAELDVLLSETPTETADRLRQTRETATTAVRAFLETIGEADWTDAVVKSFQEAEFEPQTWISELQSMQNEEKAGNGKGMALTKFMDLTKGTTTLNGASDTKSEKNIDAMVEKDEDSEVESSTEEEEEEDEFQDASMLGEYRILSQKCYLRKGATMDTEKRGHLEHGEVVDIKEIKTNPDGKVRARCASGWITMRPDLMEKLDADELGPMRSRKDVTSSTTISRRGSVAIDGISMVQLQASQAANELGKVAEQVFEVTQTHLPKAAPNIQLKIGGMGVSLYDGPLPLASYIYQRLEKWTISEKRAELTVRLAADATSKLSYFTLGCGGTERQIGELMTEHARQIFIQKTEEHRAKQNLASRMKKEKEQERATRLASGESMDEIDSEGVIYECCAPTGHANIRLGIPTSGAKQGQVTTGDKVVSLETATYESHTRIRIDNANHWVSLVNGKGEQLFKSWGAQTFDVMANAVVRDALSLKSKEVSRLKIGERVTCLEARKADGHQRLKIKDKGHWVSATTANGRVLLKPVPAKAPMARRLSISMSPKAGTGGELYDTKPSLSTPKKSSSIDSGAGVGGAEEGVPPPAKKELTGDV